MLFIKVKIYGMKGMNCMNGCNIAIDAPLSLLKGAGLLNTAFLPANIYRVKIILSNKTDDSSLCSFSVTLGNGIHYMNNLHMVGPDNIILSKISVAEPNLSIGNNNVIVFANNISLSADSENIISFDICLFDRYTENCSENSGKKIPHGSDIFFNGHLIYDSRVDSCSFKSKAKDYEVTVECEDDKISIGETTKFYINCKAGQYDMVRGVYVRSILDHGLDFVADSSNMEPRNVYSFDKRTVLKWDIGGLQPSEDKRIGYKVVLADDKEVQGIKQGTILKNKINSNCINNSTYTQCPISCQYELTVK